MINLNLRSVRMQNNLTWKREGKRINKFSNCQFREKYVNSRDRIAIMSLPSNASFQGLPEITQNTEIVIPRKENEQNKTTSAETKSVTTLIPSNQSISNKSMEQSVLSFEK